MKKVKYDLNQVMADLNLLDDAIEGMVVPGGSSAPLGRVRKYIMSMGAPKPNTETPVFGDVQKPIEGILEPVLTCYDCMACGGGRQFCCNTCGGLGRISEYRYKLFLNRPKPKQPLTASSLTFRALREANIARLPEFKNAHGRPAHEEEDGSDWSPAQWLQAVVGELGEYANIRKKFERGDIDLEEFQEMASKELADVQCYLDILARRCLDTSEGTHPTGIDLGQATIDKFNFISKRVGSTVRLAAEGWYREDNVGGSSD